MGTRAHPSELRRVRLTLICASNLSSRAAGGRVPRPHASVRVTRDWNQSRACTAEINAEKIALPRYNFVPAYIAPRIQMFIDDMEAHAKKKPGSLLIFPSGWRSADVRDQVPVMLCFTRNNDGEGFSDGEPTCTLTVVNACGPWPGGAYMYHPSRIDYPYAKFRPVATVAQVLNGGRDWRGGGASER